VLCRAAAPKFRRCRAVAVKKFEGISISALLLFLHQFLREDLFDSQK